MPRLLIIQAAVLNSPESQRPLRIRKRKMVGVIMPYLAAMVPPGWQVTLHDDAISEPDYDGPWDAVAITMRTVSSLRSYQIADKFRMRGVTVLIGGPHATFHYEEMAEHADAVCIGEGEEVFPRMLEDAAAGRLQKLYRRTEAASLDGLPTPRWDLLNMKDYVFYRPFVIQQSRGCPYTCEFCAECRLNGDYGWRCRPAEEIVDDIRKCGARHIFFAASQFVGHKGRTMELLEALIPVKIKWSALFSPRFGLDAEFLDLAKRSGLLHVNMGIESISQDTLKTMHKGFNHAQTYEEMIRNLNDRNISYSFNFVLGADSDMPDVFDATLRFLEENKVPTAYFNLMVPLRGTPVFNNMKAAGRLLDETNLERWAGVKCHFVPKNMSDKLLISEVKRMQREFYSYGSMLRRLRFPPRSIADFANWNINFIERKVAHHSDFMNEFSEF